MAEEHTGDDGLLADATTEKGSLTKGSVNARIKALKAEQKPATTKDNLFGMAAEPGGQYNGQNENSADEEMALLKKYVKLLDTESKLKAAIKKAEQELEKMVIEQYPQLSIDEIKTLAVEKTWMDTLESRIATEMDAISYRLTERIKELAERYEKPLPELTSEVEALKSKVEQHLEKMGYAWR